MAVPPDATAPSTPGPSPRLGLVLGPYRLVREIGRGGMGVVYEARHGTLGSRVAVKLLSPHPGGAISQSERVLQEALAASSVRHPGVVHVLDVGHLEDGTPYILMEYLEGESLRDRLFRLRHLSPDEATRMLRQLASALATVHAAGVVHRDIKPENVMLVPDDVAEGNERPKLLDFGIAYAPKPIPEAGPESLMGTPAYMSPEQCSRGEVTPASDVYALGVLFFEMLTGRTPYAGDAATIMRGHLFETPLDDGAIASIPSSARALLDRMLSKTPASRPAAADIAVAYAPTQSSPRLTEAPTAFDRRLSTLPPRQRASWKTWTTAACLAFAAVGATSGAWFARSRRAPAKSPPLAGMVRFDGGRFTMGRTAEEANAECAAVGPLCRRDVFDREQPARVVELSPFYLDVNEVKKEDFFVWVVNRTLTLETYDLAPPPDAGAGERPPLRLVRDRLTGGTLLDFDIGWSWVTPVGSDRLALIPGKENEPAIGVTWDAARQYCASKGKRLPTEAEWEYAARGKTHRRFPWGDAPPSCTGTIYGRSQGLPCAGMTEGTGDVAGSPQDWTPEGVHDLFGNASEWVEDAYLAPYLPDCGACKDPVVLPTGQEAADERVVRGNSWMLDNNFGQTSSRARWRRDSVTMGIGFRCAASAR